MFLKYEYCVALLEIDFFEHVSFSFCFTFRLLLFFAFAFHVVVFQKSPATSVLLHCFAEMFCGLGNLNFHQHGDRR